jgi:vancomycin resistance protein VanW
VNVAWTSAAGLLVAGAVAVGANWVPPVPKDVVLAEYATALRGRSVSQRRNAALSARALDGLRLAPGEEVSFNQLVGPWEQEPGYVRAPVSVDGSMVMALGGGVCQTSSTFYNAALLAGLSVLERHPHTVAPGYVAPGRDAAVAWPGVDLRVRNPWPFPVWVAARVDSVRVSVRVSARDRPRDRYQVVQRLEAVDAPGRRSVAVRPGRRGTRGSAGFETTTHRLRLRDGEVVEREFLSADHYPAADRLDPIAR